MIQKGSCKILKYLLDQVLSLGNLSDELHINLKTLPDELDFENEKYFHVCYQYIAEHGYILIIDNEENGACVRLTISGIDFLESH